MMRAVSVALAVSSAAAFMLSPAPMVRSRAALASARTSPLAVSGFKFEMPSFDFDFGGGNAASKGKKLCVITGASSGLGLEATRSLACDRDDYYVIAAVRDVEKMKAEAERLGISTSKYSALKCDLADFSSVRQFVKDLKQFKGSRPLDTLCCNAAVYRPTDPEPAFSADGFELSMASNHLGHFLLCNLVIEDMAKNKAKDARVIIVGSITGNSNTVGGGLVYPRADVGQFQGWEAIANGEKRPEEVPMVDGKPFFGAKAYKDTKVCNMMTISELHRRYHEDTGIQFNSLYPGCVADSNLFREKRQWFRDGFPLFMKYVTGGYVSMPESGERLAQVIAAPECAKSNVYWSWNGGAKTVAYVDPTTKQLTGAGGSGGEIFENDQSSQVSDPEKQKKMFDLSSKLVGVTWPESYKNK